MNAKRATSQKSAVDPSRGSELHKGSPFFLALTAVGVVFGDIGTSPLYTLAVTFAATGQAAPTAADVLGIISLILWALLAMVSLKYVVLVLCADNDGEGGILALLSLVDGERIANGPRIPVFVLLGIVGAALLYGDGVITPAISVLSAIEGLKLVAPAFADFIVPLTLAILIGLFMVQRRGTATIGRLFGPVMVVWFLVIGLLGAVNIVAAPVILKAIHPGEAARFVLANPLIAFAVMGGVFLALTGAEALYADMGHVGPSAIRRAWFALVLPALLLNYFGQGALVLTDPKAIDSPFYKLAPEWALIPLVLLAAMATIIASQALISGVFSLTRQAMQLGLCPRMRIVSTSSEEAGQIYVPTANWLLMIGTLLVVVLFKTSEHLAGAYGIAVSGTMLITTILLYRVAIGRWRWPPAVAVLMIAVFGAVDATFLASNSMKIVEGGWFPITVGTAMVALMLCWRHGASLVRHRLQAMSMPLARFVAHRQDGGGAAARRRRMADQGHARHLAGALAPRQAEPRVVRKVDPHDLRPRRAAAGPARRAPFDQGPRPRHLPHRGAARLHADAGHSADAQELRVARLQGRSRRGPLLHRPRDRGPRRKEVGNGGGSVRDLRVPRPDCQPRS